LTAEISCSRITLRYTGDESFALRGGEIQTSARLCSDIAAARKLIPESDGELLVTCKGHYEFSVALLAAWLSGRQVVLPPSLHAASLNRIRERHTIVAEMADGFLAGCPDSLPDHAGAFELQLDSSAEALTIYTSGSTGESKPVHKSIGNLFSEADTLKRTLNLPDRPLLASVPPYHLYGLTFSILLPWVLGVPMVDECPLHADEVLEAIERTGAGILITVPVHLRALQEHGAACRDVAVISSAGRLDAEIAANWKEKCGREIIEIYGSSETGIIAHRQQIDSSVWMPFPEVRIDRSDAGLLQVSSPFIHHGEGHLFSTQDMVALEGEGFELLGRSDSIIKIAGRRVSLVTVEEALRQCDGVVDAAVVAVPVQGHIRDMAIWAAVATGDAAGVTPRTIRTQLSSQLDSIKIPRRIVAVRELPREENGKLRRERLMSLFQEGV